MKKINKEVIILYCIITLFGFISLPDLQAQIRTTVLPDAGFEKRIEKAVNDIRLIDTHEHLRMESQVMANSNFDFTHLFQQYIKNDLISAGMSTSALDMVNGRVFPITDRWEIVKPFW